MTLKAALRWSLYDRALALGPLLLGLAIAGAGLYVGAGVYLEELLFGDPSDATEPASTPIAVAGVVLGVVAWQVGRGAVRYYALETAVDDHGGGTAAATTEQAGGGPSEVVRDTIADLENDVQTLSRKTTRLEQELHGEALGSEELESTSTAPQTGASEPAAAGGAGANTSGGDADGAAGATGDWPGAGSDDAGSESGSAGAAPFQNDVGSGAAAESTGTESATDGAATDGAVADAAESEEADAGSEATSEDDREDSEDGFEWEDEDEDGEYYRDT